MMSSNQLDSRIHILTPEQLKQWYRDRQDFLVLLPLWTTRASRSPRARLPFASVRLKYAKNHACSAGYKIYKKFRNRPFSSRFSPMKRGKFLLFSHVNFEHNFNRLDFAFDLCTLCLTESCQSMIKLL